MPLQVSLDDEGLKPLLELLDRHLLALPEVHLGAARASDVLRWDDDVAHDVDHTILSDAVLDADAGEAVNLDLDEASEARNVDAQAAVLQHRRHVEVEDTLWRELVVLSVHQGVLGWVDLVVSVGVQRASREVVLQQRTEVLEAVLREEEGVDLRAQLLEGEVGWREESAAGVVGAVDLVKQTGLGQTKLEGAELAREEVHNLDNLRRRDNDAVDTVDYTIGTKDVDGDDAAVEVDSQAVQADLKGHALRLRLASEVLTLQERGGSVGSQDTSCGVESVDDVVLQHRLQFFLARLWSVLRNLCECLVGRGEDGVVGCSVVESLDQVIILVDQLRKLGSVLALSDELVDCLVGRAVVRGMVRTTVVRGAVVWRTIVVVVKGVVEVIALSTKPGFDLRAGIVRLILQTICGLRGVVEGVVDHRLRALVEVAPNALGGILDVFVMLLEALKQLVLLFEGISVQSLAAVICLNCNVLQLLLRR